MRTTAADTVRWEEVSGHREGGIRFKRLASGLENTPDAYDFAIARLEPGYRTPRHSHNYDQVRCCLSGSLPYTDRDSLRPGWIGFFPESVPYGPQDVRETTDVLTVQCGGASGGGFMTYDQLRAGHSALAAQGTFGGGVFTRTVDGRTLNQDGYEAIYEHVFARPMPRVTPQYAAPLLVNPDGFPWEPDGPGRERRALGAFTSRRTAVAQFHLAQGATLGFGDPGAVCLLYVLSGALSGTVQSGAEVLGPGSAVSAEFAPPTDLAAPEPARLLTITLPRVRRPAGPSTPGAASSPA